MGKIRINLVVTAVWIAMLALLLIQIYQTIQLYDRKSDDFKAKLKTTTERIALVHQRMEDANRYISMMSRDVKSQYQDVLKEEFKNLFEVQESISIRDTTLFVKGKLENYLVVTGETYDSISGVSSRQEVLARDVRQIRELFDGKATTLLQEDSIRAAYHLDQRVMHKIVKKAKYINDIMVETFRDNLYMEPSKRINLPLLDSIINAELEADHLPTDYTFVVTEENNKPIEFDVHVKDYDLGLDTTKAKGATLFPDKILEDKLSLHLYFPNSQSFILQAMGSPLIISLVLMILIIVTITYMFKTILTQKKLSELKNDFISNMTHEFKTPISTISLACQAMADPGMMQGQTETAAPFVKMISDENKRLGNLVEAILQSAVLDRGELKVKTESIDLKEVIQEIAKTASFRIAGADGELFLDLPKEEIIIVADRLHVTNMISNLIDNAIKYSREKIHVTVRVKLTSSQIVIKVIDKGIGIKREYIQKIFDKLYRVPTGNVHNVKGFGLGLSYVKAIVDQFGWNISVKSQINEGSEFSITINR
jgi:two-component system phosphate regulon sensor histidine kinase PhoR